MKCDENNRANFARFDSSYSNVKRKSCRQSDTFETRRDRSDNNARNSVAIVMAVKALENS